jgi:hypothetical protein
MAKVKGKKSSKQISSLRPKKVEAGQAKGVKGGYIQKKHVSNIKYAT